MADEVINSKLENFSAYVRKKYSDGVQVAIETASKNELIRLAIDLLEYNGQLVLLGYYPEGECLVDIHWVRARETTIYCPNGTRRDRLQKTLDLLVQGHVKIKELITHEFPFSSAPKAYNMILDKSSEFLGIVLKWKI